METPAKDIFVTPSKIVFRATKDFMFMEGGGGGLWCKLPNSLCQMTPAN